MTSPLQIDFPFRIDARGATATTTVADHVRDLVEQLLFTSPGERVNRPDLGCGLADLVFAPNGVELATTLQLIVPAALLRWLPDVLTLVSADADAQDATLTVALAYVITATGELRREVFEGG